MAAAAVGRRAFVAWLVGRRRSAAAMLEFAIEDMAAYPAETTPFDDAILAQIAPAAPERLAADGHPWPQSMKDAIDERLSNVLFTLVAVSIESTWSIGAWQTRDPRSIAYLRFLGACGYKLSSVERKMIKASPNDHATRRSSTGA